MKCSDCKSFKLCVFNTDAKDYDSAENFHCFKSSIDAEEQSSSGNAGRIMSRIILWIGIIGIIISLIFLIVTWNMYGGTEWFLPPFLIGGGLLVISLVIAVTGAIGCYFSSRESRKKQENLTEVHEVTLPEDKYTGKKI